MEPRLNSTFGRRKARKITASQQELLDNLLPTLLVNDVKRVSGSKILEIGFGNGEFLHTYAKNNPAHTCFGAEPFINGVALLLKRIVADPVDNIRIFNDDVRILLKTIPDRFLDKIFIICPDPWPKRRQAHRRLVTYEFLQYLSSKIKTGGVISIVTDHQDYAEWIYKHAKNTKELGGLGESVASHILSDQGEWLYTKYQRRGLGLEHKIYIFNLGLN